MALWCNWLTHLPVTQKSTGSSPVRVVKEVFLMLKDRMGLDYSYPMPEIQDTIEQTVSYNWNAEKPMKKVLVELHNIHEKEKWMKK